MSALASKTPEKKLCKEIRLLGVLVDGVAADGDVVGGAEDTLQVDDVSASMLYLGCAKKKKSTTVTKQWIRTFFCSSGPK